MLVTSGAEMAVQVDAKALLMPRNRSSYHSILRSGATRLHENAGAAEIDGLLNFSGNGLLGRT